MKNPEKNEPVAPNFPAEAVQSEVERILASDKFARSKRLCSLLQFTVSQTLEGHADSLKEYVIGTEVLNKPDSYDPRRDSLVRVLASRLRMKLREYYNNGGSDDPLVIEFPKGKYVPRFQRREQLQTEMQRRLSARNAYSRGKFLMTRLSEENLTEAIERFGEASAAEPDWAPPHIEHATASAVEGFLGFRRPREAWPPVRVEADAALAIDEMSADAHIALGMFHAFFGWRWREAESHFLKAIERDGYSGAGHIWRAVGVLLPFGKLREAEEELSKARQLAAAPFLEEGQLLADYLSGRHEAVIEATSMSSGSAWSVWLRGCALAAAGRMKDAIEVLSAIDNPDTRVIATLGHCYGIAGETERARELEAQLEGRRQSGAWVSYYDRAVIAAGLGDAEEAISRLQEACRENEPWMAFLALDPRMVALRSAPRFGGFIRRVLSSETDGQM